MDDINYNILKSCNDFSSKIIVKEWAYKHEKNECEISEKTNTNRKVYPTRVERSIIVARSSGAEVTEQSSRKQYKHASLVHTYHARNTSGRFTDRWDRQLITTALIKTASSRWEAQLRSAHDAAAYLQKDKYSGLVLLRCWILICGSPSNWLMIIVKGRKKFGLWLW